MMPVATETDATPEREDPEWPAAEEPLAAERASSRCFSFVPRRLVRSLGSLTLVMLAFCLYDVTVAPFIVPPTAPIVIESPRPPGPLPDPVASQRDGLRRWFSPGDWELTNLKVLKTPQGTLLLDQYRKLGDRVVQIRRCTMIFESHRSGLSTEEQARQAVILQAPQGAKLEFDEKIDLRRAQIGRLIGGQLVGPIVIRSEQRLPGPEDDLRIEARDVVLKENRVSTPHRIDFRWGAHRGRGAGLEIVMLADEAAGNQQGPNIEGVQSLSLSRDVRMHLELGSGSPFDEALLAGADRNGPAEPSAAPPQPIEAACRGPFRFDLEQESCTFEDQVRVWQPVPGAEENRLTCRLLTLHFAPGADYHPVTGPGRTKSRVAAQRLSKLQVRRLEAIGEPVVVRSPSRQAEARCHRLEYRVNTRRIRLEAAPAEAATGVAGDGVPGEGEPGEVVPDEVVVVRVDQELHAPALEYQPGPDGQWGRAWAAGPGWLRGTAPDETDRRSEARPVEARRFEARWSNELRLQPHGSQANGGTHRLTLDGNASVVLVGTGGLAAAEIHAWIKPAEKRDEREDGLDAERDGAQDELAQHAGSPQQAEEDPFIPQRLLAKDNVRFESTQLNGKTDKLEMWFKSVPAAAKRSVPAAGDRGLPAAEEGASRRGTPVLPAGMRRSRAEVRPVALRVAARPFLPRSSDAQEGPPQHFDVSGNSIQVTVRVRGRELNPSVVNIEGGARFAETVGPAGPPQAPLQNNPLQNNPVQNNPGPSNPGQANLAQKDAPMVVEGDTLHVDRPTGDAAKVSVTGKPAHVEGRGMSLTGLQIDLNQASNMLWVDGAGRMTLQTDRDLEGRPSDRPQQLEVRWQKKMEFDGRRAVFSQKVIAEQNGEQAKKHLRTEQHLRTDLLEVVLDRPIDFKKMKQEATPGVEQVICRQGALMNRRIFGPRGLLAREQVKTADLTMDRRTGDITARGPGRVTRADLGRPAGVLGSSPAGKPTRPGQPAQPEKKPAQGNRAAETINYLNVEFQQSLNGNLNRRESVFTGQVEAVYGPIPTWESAIDPNRLEQLGDHGVVLTCDRLEVGGLANGQQLDGAQSLSNAELQATGNAVAEGRTFTAGGSRLSYQQAKDLLILEGDSRVPAQLSRQERVGGPVSNLAAARITFHQTSNRAEVQNIKKFDSSFIRPRQR